MKDGYKITNCLLCDGSIELILELTPTPPANELVENSSIDQGTFPLNLMRCTKCSHLQLDIEINKERLYKNYFYTSNTSASNREYFKSYAFDIMFDHFANSKRKQFVVDIGSNDGLFLSSFKNNGHDVLGVDPAQNIADQANKNGITTKCAFFNKETAGQILDEHGKATIITCNNCFAHNKDLSEIVNGIKLLLDDTGIFVFEVVYGINMLESGTFDLLYHEHIHTHLLSSLIHYFNKFDLSIYDAQKISTHGGSIRVFVKHSSKFEGQTKRLGSLLRGEINGVVSELCHKFQKNVEKVRDDVVKVLQEIKDNGKTIGVLGWPAKATTCSYYFDLEKFIDNVFDDNPLKIGKLTPGQHFPVLSTKEIYNPKYTPDYMLILSWNYAQNLIKTHKQFSDNGGKFIIPLPQLQVVS